MKSFSSCLLDSLFINKPYINMFRVRIQNILYSLYFNNVCLNYVFVVKKFLYILTFYFQLIFSRCDKLNVNIKVKFFMLF